MTAQEYLSHLTGTGYKIVRTSRRSDAPFTIAQVLKEVRESGRTRVFLAQPGQAIPSFVGVIANIGGPAIIGERSIDLPEPDSFLEQDGET